MRSSVRKVMCCKSTICNLGKISYCAFLPIVPLTCLVKGDALPAEDVQRATYRQADLPTTELLD